MNSTSMPIVENRKKTHADCGGEIEEVLLSGELGTFVKCKKCDEQEVINELK